MEDNKKPIKQRLYLSLEEDDVKKIRDNAKKSKLTVSQYIIRLVENKPIHIVKDLAQFAVELKRIGNNINQMTKVVNAQKFVDYEARRALKDNRKELERMAEQVNKIILNINCPTERTLSEKENDIVNTLENIRSLSDKIIERIKVGE